MAGTVGVVARATRTVADRWVYVRALINRYAMALRAELSAGISAEQGGVLGPMWIVAQNAHPHLHRFVDEVRLGKTVVAGVTQFRIVSSAFELVPRPGAKRRGAPLGHMTSVAPVFHQRFVDTFMLHDRGVTIRRRARRRKHRRSAARRFLSDAGCGGPGSDKTAEHHIYNPSHASPTKLDRLLFHPSCGGCLELAHPHRLHGLQTPPDNAG